MEEQIGDEVEQDQRDEEEAGEVTVLNRVHVVSEQDQGVAGQQDAALVKGFINIDPLAIVGSAVHDIDQVQLREEDEEHDLEGRVVTQQDGSCNQDQASNSEQEGAQQMDEGL